MIGESHWVQTRKTSPPPKKKSKPALSSQRQLSWTGKLLAQRSCALQNCHTSAAVHTSTVETRLSAFPLTQPRSRFKDPELPPPHSSSLTRRF